MDGPQVAGPSKVRWAYDLNDNDQSIVSDSTSLPSGEISSSTLAFANSQLVAHGFIRSPGLQLDALAVREQDILAKCLLTVLGQRTSDVTRCDELTVKLRTLTYDHERLKSLLQVAEDKAANAEREAELAKSRMNAANKSLIAEQNAHKLTSATLQKAQSALQYNRATAQNEIKKKEKEVEKHVDRWQRLCNEQARLGSVGSGMACANLAVLEGEDGPKGDSLLEQAMTELEAHKSRLLSENDALRDVVLSAARALQTVVQSGEVEKNDLPPPLLTASQLFAAGDNDSACFYDAATQALNAHHKLKGLVNSLRTKMETLQARDGEFQRAKQNKRDRDEWIKERDQMVTDLMRAKEEAERLSEQLGKAGSTKISEALKRDTKAAKQVEEAAQRLRDREAELEREREEFSEAALRLGQEREALEAELHQLKQEKRARQARQSLAHAPDSPELRRELDIQKNLPPTVETDVPDSGSGLIHRVRRSRYSLDDPSTANAIPTAHVQVKEDKGKRKAVAFSEHVQVSVPKRSRRSATPPSATKDGPAIEYVLRDDIEPPASAVAGPSTYPDAESTPVPASERVHTPRKSTNPFEEVLLRSAQRPRPIINGNTLPTFQPITRFSSDSGPAGSSTSPNSTNSGTSSTSSSGESASSRRGGSPRKSTSPKGRRHSPPKVMGRDPTKITPPLFTHRRIVGKKHQYAPAVPSPLSKYVKMAESSSEPSIPEIDVADDHNPASESFSPTNAMLAGIAGSGGRMNGGLAAIMKAKTQRIKQTPSAALDFGPSDGAQEDEGDDEGVWEAVDDALELALPAVAQDGPRVTAVASPRNDDPLTEEDLMPMMPMKSKKAGLTRPEDRKAISKAVRAPPVRPTAVSHPKAKPVRPAMAIKPLANQALAPTVKGKEKENVPTTKPVAVPHKALSPITSPVKKTISTKVAVGRISSKPSLLKSAKTVPVMSKQLPKISALRDRRKLDLKE
ncbi:hypothetical protein FRB97_007754 [Tulasnella sp. 331]|nr:hypothetical protein FRB97_007754 [Tulasnella sp. 331]